MSLQQCSQGHYVDADDECPACGDSSLSPAPGIDYLKCESGHYFTPDNLDYGYKCDCGDYAVEAVQSGDPHYMQCASGHIFTPDNLNYGYKCDCGDYVIDFLRSGDPTYMKCVSGHVFTPDNLNYGYKCDCGDYVIDFLRGESDSFTCESGHQVSRMDYGYKCPECGSYIVSA